MVAGIVFVVVAFSIGVALVSYGMGYEEKPYVFLGLAICFFTGLIGWAFIPKADLYSSTYYLPCELVAINDNTKFFEDNNGNLWTWEDDRVYDMDILYLLTMNDNDTRNNLTDDIIQVVWQLGGEEIDNSVG